jgi:hypothetical protein
MISAAHCLCYNSLEASTAGLNRPMSIISLGLGTRNLCFESIFLGFREDLFRKFKSINARSEGLGVSTGGLGRGRWGEQSIREILG